MRLLQTNLGRSRRAQDLLSQTIRESGVALAAVAEPYCIPDVPDWVRDLNGLIAVAWTPALGSPGVLLDRGSGYVAVKWAGMVLVGVYVSPNSGLAAFEDFLDGVGECIRRYLPARCSSWGTSTPTLRNGATPERTHVGGCCQSGPQD
ncbi:uncharacterized protein LOC122574358 [Bombus pyrosoma]|uniref:uncharacterized protein LOC122574358 n=1 Tax=Bombus pyrosoma TaxID=396416 RepID=UPI001CB8AF6A|nr:uncharacterized protein LOC122574358 [Bombus pyrosoma]